MSKIEEYTGIKEAIVLLGLAKNVDILIKGEWVPAKTASLSYDKGDWCISGLLPEDQKYSRKVENYNRTWRIHGVELKG